MQLLWTWSHSNSNNKAVARALDSLAMLKTQEHSMFEEVLYLHQHPDPARLALGKDGGRATGCRYVWLAGQGGLSSEQMEIAPNNGTGSGGLSSQRLSQCSSATPALHIVLLWLRPLFN